MKNTTISWQTMKKHNYQLADNEKIQLSVGRQ